MGVKEGQVNKSSSSLLNTFEFVYTENIEDTVDAFEKNVMINYQTHSSHVFLPCL